MAEGKLQIEQRVDRIEMAVSMMLVQMRSRSLGPEDAERIERVLKGEKPKEPEDDASEEPSAA